MSHSPETEPGSTTERDKLVRRFHEVVRLLHSFGDPTKADETLTLMNESGLTIPQLITLNVLRLHGPHSVSEIADRTRLSRPATSHLVDRLVARRLLTRVEDLRDRRHKRISVSRKGMDLVDRLLQARQARVAAGLDTLSEVTRAQLAAVLGDVERELKERARARGIPEEALR